MKAGPTTGGVPMSFERGDTSKERLRPDWLHPVPPNRNENETSASGPLSLADALAILWESGDNRPLLVLRQCNLCKDGDEALVTRALRTERTILLSKWFRLVRLPRQLIEPTHPFHAVFASYGFKDGAWPHVFLLAHPGAKPVHFMGQQTQSQLWKGMCDVLSERYAKDPVKQVKQWLTLLDTFDAIDGRERQTRDQLDQVRATDGPQSAKAKKLMESLANLAKERDEALSREAKVRDLGLLPMPVPVAAAPVK